MACFTFLKHTYKCFIRLKFVTETDIFLCSKDNAVVYEIQKYIANSANLNNYSITIHSWAKKLYVIDLLYISVYLSHLVSIVLVCDLGACFDRTVRWLSAYPKFVSYLP